MAGTKEGFSHKAKAFFFTGFLMVTYCRRTNVREFQGLLTSRGGALAKRGTRLIELPLESQLFVRFFRRRDENFTY